MAKFADVLSEVAHGFRLGLRDTLRPSLALTSIAVALGAAMLVLIGVVGFFSKLYPWLHALVLVGLHWVWEQPMGWIVTMLTWISLVALYVLGVVLLVQLALELFLMQRIQKVCRTRYPHLRDAKSGLSIRHGLRDTLRTTSTMLVGGAACLLIPVIGGVLLLALSSYLAVRGLVNDALDGLASEAQVKQMIRESRPQLLLMGLMVALFAIVPFMGLLAPVMAGASTCHLMMDRLGRIRSTP